jgi:hypothetical protein
LNQSRQIPDPGHLTIPAGLAMYLTLGLNPDVRHHPQIPLRQCSPTQCRNALLDDHVIDNDVFCFI